jgi:hypothetical protein
MHHRVVLPATAGRGSRLPSRRRYPRGATSRVAKISRKWSAPYRRREACPRRPRVATRIREITSAPYCRWGLRKRIRTPGLNPWARSDEQHHDRRRPIIRRRAHPGGWRHVERGEYAPVAERCAESLRMRHLASSASSAERRQGDHRNPDRADTNPARGDQQRKNRVKRARLRTSACANAAKNHPDK